MAETKINGNVSESSGVEDNDEEPRFDGQMARNMVFQCNACNTILGDSTAWVTGEPDLGTFTLRRKSLLEVLPPLLALASTTPVLA